MPAWLAPAITAAGMGISAAIAKGKDKRQLEQQEKLDAQQSKWNNINMSQQNVWQKALWDSTNYEAQMQHIKAAGLNPAMMYGIGGGGGTTAGSASGTGSAPDAPKGTGQETETWTGMGIQTAQAIAQQKLIDAQTKNIEADTANKLSENPNIGKTGKKIDTEIQDITQGIMNKQAQQALTEAQSRAQDLANQITSASKADQIATWSASLEKLINEVEIGLKDKEIAQATVQDKIDQIKAEAIGAALKNKLTEAQTANTKANTTNTQADLPNIQQKLKQMITEQRQGWEKLRIDEQNQLINKTLTEAGLDLKDRDQMIDAIRDIIGLGLLTHKNERR